MVQSGRAKQTSRALAYRQPRPCEGARIASLRIFAHFGPLMLGIYFHMQVADALRERAQRIYEKYGNVMLETEGMTKAGIERKATCRALFSKLLYLAGEPPAVHARGDIACGVSVELNSRGPALIGMPKAMSS